MAAASTISEGTAIRGRLKLDGDLEVHGQVEGGIEAGGDVTLGSGAMLKGDLAGRQLVVAGAVNGNLQGRTQVVLEAGARVQGDVSAPSVGIRPGALVRGHIDAAGGAGTTAPKARAVVADKPVAKETAKPAPKPAKKSARRAAPAPVIPKASGRGKKAAPKTRKAAPAPRVPALKKRTKKAAKRRAR